MCARHSGQPGASVLSLPPYSPDLNPIEQLFAKLKTILRSAAAPRTKDALWATFGAALDAFPPETSVGNYLAHCGYEFT